MAVAHYLEALEWQRDFIKIHAMLGGKNPHLQTYLVGGMATPVDPDKQAAINMGSIAEMRGLIAKARDFVAQVYIPDLLAVASFYKEWAGTGPAWATTWSTASSPRTTRSSPSCSCPRASSAARTSPRSRPSIPTRSPST